ncbi:MAG: class I SAM-dependent methyltransferase [Hylemonella sp.]
MSVIRAVIDKTVDVAGLVLQGRRVHPTVRIGDGRVCVNLGCGLAVAPSWINVDASLNALFAGAPNLVLRQLYRLSGANRYYSEQEYVRLLTGHKFIFHDLARSLPFHEDAVDVFYSSHFFEHLFKKDAERLLREMHAALKGGGLIRIAVPDLSHAVALYGQGKTKEMLENYFFVDDRSSYLARHKYMYDFENLGVMLAEAGYRDIRRCNYREGMCPDVATLDNRPEETLYVEAIR